MTRIDTQNVFTSTWLGLGLAIRKFFLRLSNGIIIIRYYATEAAHTQYNHTQ